MYTVSHLVVTKDSRTSLQQALLLPRLLKTVFAWAEGESTSFFFSFKLISVNRGKGSIYIVGSGTKTLSVFDQNVNFDAYASSPYTIAVGGIDDGLYIPSVPGFHAYGSALLVVAPTATGASRMV
jgi:hypothetical protein